MKTNKTDEVLSKDPIPTEPGANSDVAKMLQARPKVRVRVPLPNGLTLDEARKQEKPPYVPVGINGYFYQVPKGYTVEVPDVVADLLAEANYI